MKKGQIVEGIIERVDFPNKGILRADDCLKYWKNLHWSCRNLDVFIMGSVVAVHSRAFHMRNRLR